MRETVRRAINARPELTAELLRRGMFKPEEKVELLRCQSECNGGSEPEPLGMMEFTALLSRGDAICGSRGVAKDAQLRGIGPARTATEVPKAEQKA